MATIGLVFGTDTGNTEEVGGKIAEALRNYGYIVEMVNISEASPEVLLSYPFLILGIPTWDFGGIQEDWEDFESTLLALDLSNRVVALYGLGDQRGYGDYFVDAMGWLHERVAQVGAQIIGRWSTEGYKFSASLAANDDLSEFCGLAIDEDQQFELTDSRVNTWVAQIVDEFEQLAVAL
ncbi:flavodoxin [Cellvibrio japonicus]|uniref:Flavodoxin n=1 Tax=Cellvibrio japonicus (strain Ueda107) TaxID=498211 RepID=B3PCG2_CELJU|nr:flavodoxin [Cellvibrio japonicus]ACE85383.1 flavodoxin [Cellvibrio japonicus Ueda107]QEI11866.1 flavodoxin [Cellvibrio japonicus]QEI15440.1 flavodoxin [Cellvibrio japonicus]QEI19019.1 flavodoxin [Cellvibrio japonicus]